MNTSLSMPTLQSEYSTKIDKDIVIVASSNSARNALTEKTRLSVHGVLNRHYRSVRMITVDNIQDLEILAAQKPDFVILGVNVVLLDPSAGYRNSPKVWVSSYLKKHEINYLGSDKGALDHVFGKHKVKQRVMDAGLRSAAYFIVELNQPVPDHRLTFPLFVKPTNRGGSQGIDEKSLVRSPAELQTKVTSIHIDYGADALVEEYLSGREFSVAVVKRPSTGVLLALPVEIQAPADDNGYNFLSESVKKNDTEQVTALADMRLKKAVCSLATGAFAALGARDYGRIDIRLDNDNFSRLSRLLIHSNSDCTADIVVKPLNTRNVDLYSFL